MADLDLNPERPEGERDRQTDRHSWVSKVLLSHFTDKETQVQLCMHLAHHHKANNWQC